MRPWLGLLLPLPLWMGLKVDVIMGNCIIPDLEYDDMGRCVCTANSLQNPLEMLICLQTNELELQDGVLQIPTKYLPLQDSPEIQGLDILPLERMLFTRVQIPGVFLSALLKTLPKTNVYQMDFTEATLEALPNPHNSIQPCPITTLRMDRVTFDPSLVSLNGWLLSSVTHLTLRGMPGVLSLSNGDCITTAKLANLTELDLSENGLTDESLANLSRCLLSSSTPPVHLGLSVLRLSHNQLHSLQAICPLLQASPHLVELDLSHNTLNDFAFDSSCFNSSTELRNLNLSYTGIRAVDGLVPANVEVLDLSGNLLQEFRNFPHGITELYLSNNHLSLLPDLKNATQLQFLTLNGNRLTDLPRASTLEPILDHLSVLRAGGNPFTCGCELRGSVELLRRNHDKVLDWPDAFLCIVESNNTTLRLEDLDFSNCEHTMSKASFLKMNVDFTLCMSVVVAVISAIF